MKTVAIIAAGGSGSRMQSNHRKQYMLLGSVPLVIHALDVFQQTPIVDDIFLILPGEDVSQAEQEIVTKYHLSKVKRVLPGGLYRQDSVKRGIDEVSADYDIVVIHDGVRPFVSRELIEIVIGGADKTGAASIGVPAKETIKETDPLGFVHKTLPRENLWLIQTPQAFRASLIREAYNRAYHDHYYATDDATLVERMAVKVKIIMGTEDNIKITTKSDLRFAEHLLTMRGFGRSGH